MDLKELKDKQIEQMKKKRQTMKSAGAIVFTIKNSQILYLLLKHIKTDTHWGFPKGRVERNETDKESAIREVIEETGLRNLTFLKGFERKEEYSFKRKKDEVVVDKTVTYFILESNFSEIKVSEEHSEFVWGTFEETLKKLEHEDQKEFLRIVNKKIKLEKAL